MKVEGWLIALALISMLSLAVYGIVYRNAVVPLVSYLQTSDVAPPAGEVEVAAAPAAAKPAIAPAPALAPASDDAESDFDSDFGGGDAKPAAGQEPESDFDSDFGGGDAKPAAGQEPESDFDSDFGGGADAAKPVAAVVVPPPPPPVIREDSALVRLLLWLNFDWIDIVMRHLILWLAFLGGALATEQRKHIAIDALARRMPAKARPTIAAVVATVSLVVCGALAYAAFNFTTLEASHGRALFGAVPGWVGPAIIPVGFGLIGLHYMFRLAEAVAALAGKHELPPDALEVTLQ